MEENVISRGGGMGKGGVTRCRRRRLLLFLLFDVVLSGNGDSTIYNWNVVWRRGRGCFFRNVAFSLALSFFFPAMIFFWTCIGKREMRKSWQISGPRGGGKYNQSSIDHCFSGELLEVLATKRRKNFSKVGAFCSFPEGKGPQHLATESSALSRTEFTICDGGSP